MPEPKTGSKGFLTAWRKGKQAALDGKSIDACPYTLSNTESRKSFKRRWERHWCNGWEDGKKELDDGQVSEDGD